MPARALAGSDSGTSQMARFSQADAGTGLQRVPPPPPPPGTSLVVESFATGHAVQVGPDVILIETSERGKVALHLSPTTDIWESRWVKSIPIEVGDHIMAWGARRTDRAHDVEKLWVNLVNLQGTVSNVKKEMAGLTFHHHDSRQGAHIVKIDQRTLVALRDSPKVTFASRPVDLAEGQFSQVIGRKVKDDSVLATDVYL